MKHSYSCPAPCPQSGSEKPFYGSTCSRSKSCLIYGDCCCNARYKNTHSVNLDKTCITLNGLGPVSLVSSCPSNSRARSETSHTGLRNTFPVTSKTTGTSYANFHYAFCNKDISNLIGWPVQLRCSEEERPTETFWPKSLVETFVQHQSKQNQVKYRNEYGYNRHLSCDYKLFAENEDLTFIKSLELRKCVRAEISECWHQWRNETTKDLCASYLDPVLSLNRVYRNEHCAKCNSEQHWIRTCLILPTSKAVPGYECDFTRVMKPTLCKPKSPKTPSCPEGQTLRRRDNKCVQLG